MKSFIILSLSLVSLSFAQTGELTPEQLKKIEQREAAAKAKLEEQKISAEKIRKLKEDAALAKAAEQKRIEAENKKKADVEATTRWLISERDRKLKESAETKVNEEEKNRVEAENKKKADGLAFKMEKVKEGSGFSGEGQGSGQASVTSSCVKNGITQAWEKEFRRLRGVDIRQYPRQNFNSITEENFQSFLCSCRYPENTKFPDSVKILGLSGYEGKSADNEQRGFNQHPETNVAVKVNEPVILVLDAYEPIRWKISGPVIGIFSVGFYKQTIDIDDGIRILKSQMLGADAKYSQGSDLCRMSDAALIMDSSMNSHDGHTLVSDYEGASRRKILDDRSLLLFGRKLTSYRYQYTLPREINLSTESD